MQTLPFDVELPVPADVAICPYCSGKLTATFTGWAEDGDALKADETHLTCENETEDGDDHTAMPYVYWLPVEMRVQNWVNRNYVFGDDDGNSNHS